MPPSKEPPMNIYTILKQIFVIASGLKNPKNPLEYDQFLRAQEAKALVDDVTSDLKYISEVLTDTRSETELVPKVREYHNKRIEYIHDRFEALYDYAKTKTPSLTIEHLIRGMKAIATDLPHLCNRIESYILTTESRPKPKNEKTKKNATPKPKESKRAGLEPTIVSYKIESDKAVLFWDGIGKLRKFRDAPIDCDWWRFAMVHNNDGKDLLLVAQYSNKEHCFSFYVFEWDSGDQVYQYSNRRIEMKNLPTDVDLTSFDVVIHPETSAYTFYFKKQEVCAFYLIESDSIDKDIDHGIRSLLNIGERFPTVVDTVDWKRWFVCTRKHIWRICAYKTQKTDEIVKFKPNSHETSTITVEGEYAKMEMACTSAAYSGTICRMYQMTFHDFSV